MAEQDGEVELVQDERIRERVSPFTALLLLETIESAY
jgi:hypothetical protein